MQCPIIKSGDSLRTSALLTLLRGEVPNDEAMGYQLGALATCVAALVYISLRRCRKLSTIEDVPGPMNPSWIFGTFLRAN